MQNLLALNGAPEPLKERIREGRVAAATVITALRTPDPIKTIEAAIEVADASGKDRATPRHVKEAQQIADGNAAPKAPRLGTKQVARLGRALFQVARFSKDEESKAEAIAALREVGLIDERGPRESGETRDASPRSSSHECLRRRRVRRCRS